MKCRCYTFVARCDFDSPYALAEGASYCEWDYKSHKQICIGYIQYSSPRAVPKWAVRVVFSPSNRSYLTGDHFAKEYKFGTPKLPHRYVPPTQPRSAVYGPDWPEFCRLSNEKNLEEIRANRIARRSRKDAIKESSRKRPKVIFNLIFFYYILYSLILSPSLS